ncbi:hypothetical protein LINGRAHAP2_LOCUS1718 [Linum grandiflorum]
MSKLKRSPKNCDQYLYKENQVLCFCGIRASHRISHTLQNPNRNFFECLTSKSKVCRLMMVSSVNSTLVKCINVCNMSVCKTKKDAAISTALASKGLMLLRS